MRFPAVAGAILGLVTLTATAAWPQEDLFAFIPPGGRSLTADLLKAHPEALATLGTARTAAEWDSAAPPGAEALDEWQRRTLADYLAYAGAITDPANLPADGRDMALAKCQSCHIITVTVTQKRSREAWLGTMNKPSHVGVPLSPADRGQLADYLTVNAGIPIDDIPPALRAGGASY